MSYELSASRMSTAQSRQLDGAAQTERMQARMAELDLIHTAESERLGALTASVRKMAYAASRIIGK